MSSVQYVSFQTLLNNIGGVWDTQIDHTRSIDWGKRTGISIPLNDTEAPWVRLHCTVQCSMDSTVQ